MLYSLDLRHFLILGPNSKWIQPVLTILSSYRKYRPIFAIWIVHFRRLQSFDYPLKFNSRQRFIYDKTTGKMIFKESIGEIIRLGDELVSIDDVSVNGKLASDCEEAVKKSLRLTAIPFGTGIGRFQSSWTMNQ